MFECASVCLCAQIDMSRQHTRKKRELIQAISHVSCKSIAVNLTTFLRFSILLEPLLLLTNTLYSWIMLIYFVFILTT